MILTQNSSLAIRFTPVASAKAQARFNRRSSKILQGRRTLNELKSVACCKDANQLLGGALLLLVPAHSAVFQMHALLFLQFCRATQRCARVLVAERSLLNRYAITVNYYSFLISKLMV